MTILANMNLAQRVELSDAQGGFGMLPVGLVLDGVTDNSTAIANALAVSKIVRLPAGTIKADFTLPSGCTLIGAGQQRYGPTGAWAGVGTRIIGRVVVTGSDGWTIRDLAIDAYDYAPGGTNADAIDGKSDATRNGFVRRVTTRANNHNMLFEKNLSTGNAASDAAGDVVNNIVVEDCELNGGPNGIAIKMRGVKVLRTVAYDVTAQAFVVVSDTINGATIYSRARDVVFQDCDAYRCGTIFRVYSRYNQGTTNTAGVLAASNIRWFGGRLCGSSIYGAEIGDPNTFDATGTRIKCTDVWIIGADVRDNAQAGLFFETCADNGYDNCYFDNNGTGGGANAGFGVQTGNATLPGGAYAVTNLTHGTSNAVSSNCLGYETGQKSRQSQNGGATQALSSSQKGITQTNRGSSGALTLTLPTNIQEGDEYPFAVPDGQSFSIISAVPAANRIRQGALLAAGAVTTTAVGSTIRVKATRHNSNNLEWWIIQMTGTWTGLA